jgi:hypothetical protein
MDKSKYIRTRLSKLTHKSWELFVISRIIHRLDDLSIEFVCQQMVLLEDGARKMTDLYFPQFGLHLEIDEPGHADGEAQRRDLLRAQDIIAVTGDAMVRIATYGPDGKDLPVDTVAREVDAFIGLIRRKKQEALEAGDFMPWDLSRYSDPSPYRAKGSIHVSDNVAFTHQIAALRCFGFTGQGWMKATWPLNDGSGRAVWLPRLFAHQGWNNRLTTLSDDEVVIEVERADGGPLDTAYPDTVFEPYPERIVFARDTDSYGMTLYRFIGVFQIDRGLSTPTQKVYWRTSRSAPTAPLDATQQAAVPQDDAPAYDPHEKFGGAGILPMGPNSPYVQMLKAGTLTLKP